MPTLPEAAGGRNTAWSADDWLWRSSRLYARAYGWFKDRTGQNLKGLGFLLRHLRRDREFDACGHRWFFDHRIGSSYIRLIGGSYNEPETHALLGHVARAVDGAVTFVDVGANIGEMVVAMAAGNGVAGVIAFEAHPTCAEVCRRNLALNHLTADVRHVLVGDGTPQPFVINERYAHISGIRRDDDRASLTPTVRLDDQLGGNTPCMLLIDVEGAELDVLRGAQRFVAANRPLIIFEYNSLIQRAVFELAEVRALLGERYELFRLRVDGHLDRDLADTWNCVAVHADSVFASICQRRMR